MKIIFFETPKTEQAVLIKSFGDADITFYEEKLNEGNINLAKDAEIVSVFINSEINKNIIEALPNLKFISTRSTGFDHIDVAYCKIKNIQVSNVPAYGSETVAEFAFALILSLSRKIFNACRQLKEDGDFSIFQLQGFDLNGKTIGVIGTGKIGKNAIRIAKGFNMNVVAYDAYPDNTYALGNGFIYASLPELLAQSDIVTIHAPYNEGTHHLINKDNIKLFKKGALLINTARGEIVDTEALLFGLKEKIIAGAGLDVLEGERILKEEKELLGSEHADHIKDFKILVEDRALIDMPNVIVTPHIAFYSKEAEASILKTTAENIKGFIVGNLVNLVSTKGGSV